MDRQTSFHFEMIFGSRGSPSNTLLSQSRGPGVQPDNGIVQWLASHLIPDDRSFSLVGQSNALHFICRNTHLTQLFVDFLEFSTFCSQRTLKNIAHPVGKVIQTGLDLMSLFSKDLSDGNTCQANNCYNVTVSQFQARRNQNRTNLNTGLDCVKEFHRIHFHPSWIRKELTHLNLKRTPINGTKNKKYNWFLQDHLDYCTCSGL